MSHFFGWALYPETGRPYRAMWIDGAFGGRRYGVQFLGLDGQPIGPIHREEDVTMCDGPDSAR